MTVYCLFFHVISYFSIFKLANLGTTMGRLNKKLKASTKAGSDHQVPVAQPAAAPFAVKAGSGEPFHSGKVLKRTKVASSRNGREELRRRVKTAVLASGTFGQPQDVSVIVVPSRNDGGKKSSSLSLAREKELNISRLQQDLKKRANQMRKKDRLTLKRELLREKLNLREIETAELKAEAKRRKTVIVGDVKPMVDTLTDLFEESKAKAVEDREKAKAAEAKAIKSRGATPKRKKAQDQLLRGIAMFNQISGHPEYKGDPFRTISSHIENKVLLESARVADKALWSFTR